MGLKEKLGIDSVEADEDTQALALEFPILKISTTRRHPQVIWSLMKPGVAGIERGGTYAI